MGTRWPAAASTAPSGCGTSHQTVLTRSGAGGSVGGVQPPMGTRWPAAAPTALGSGCGMSPIQCTPARSAPAQLTFRHWVSWTTVEFSPERVRAGQRRLRAGALRPVGVADPAHPRPLGQPLTGTVGPRLRSGVQPRQGTRWPAATPTALSGLWVSTDPAHPPPAAARMAAGRRHRSPRLRQWRSTPAGARWPAAITAAPSGCGMLPIRRTPARSGQPPTSRAAVVGFSVAFSPGRAHAGQRQRPRHNPAVACRRSGGTPAPYSSTLTGAAAPVNWVGIQPRRAHAGQQQRPDGTIRLWDVADPAQTSAPLGQPLTGGTDGRVPCGVRPRRASRWPAAAPTAPSGSGT